MRRPSSSSSSSWRPPVLLRRGIFLLAFTLAWVTLFVQVALQVEAHGPPIPFYPLLQTPANYTLLTAWLAAFFEFAVVLTLFLMALLSYYPRTSLLAAASCALGAYLATTLALFGSDLLAHSAAYSSIKTAGWNTMWYMILAECAEGTLVWWGIDIALFSATAIALSLKDPRYASAVEFRVVLATATMGWEVALFYTYFVVSGLLRVAALHDCQLRNAKGAKERWWYRLLIVSYLALWLSIFAYQSMIDSLGLATAQLYTAIVYNALLLSFCPLVLVLFMNYSRANEDALHVALATALAARDAAESAEKSRREYLGYVFHEVRVPFSALSLGIESLSAELAAGDIEYGRARSDLSLMRSSAQLMQQVLNDTLDVEKMGSGMYVISPRPTNVAAVMSRVHRSMLPLAAHEGVKLELSIDPAVPPVLYTDPERLRQIAANFVSNGCKFSAHDGSGRVLLRLSVVAELSQGDALTTQWRDDVQQPQQEQRPQQQQQQQPLSSGAAPSRTLSAANSRPQRLASSSASSLLDHSLAEAASVIKGRVLVPPPWLVNKLNYYACMQTGPNLVTAGNQNAHITVPLSALVDEYEAGYESNDTFRAKMTARAVELLKRLPWKITHPSQLARLRDNQHIGASTLAKIEQQLVERRIDQLEEYRNNEERRAVRLFQTVWGIGPCKSRALASAPHFLRTIEQLKATLMGPNPPRYQRKPYLDDDAKVCLKYYQDMQQRIPRAEVEEIVALVRAAAEEVYHTTDLLVVCCGSFRRGKATCGDVDILIAPQRQRGKALSLKPLVERLQRSRFLVHTLRMGGMGFEKAARDVGQFEPTEAIRSGIWTQTPGWQRQQQRQAGGCGSVVASGGGAKRSERPWDAAAAPASSSSAAAATTAASNSSASNSATAPPPSEIPQHIAWDQLEKLPQKDYDSESFMGVCRLPPRSAPSAAGAGGLPSATADRGGCSSSSAAPAAAAAAEPRLARRIDLKSYPRDTFAFALQYFTGSDYFNRSMRNYVKKCGWSLSDKGLKAVMRGTKEGDAKAATDRVAESPSIRCDTEEDIFRACGIPWKAPTERNCEVEPAALAAQPGAPSSTAAPLAAAAVGVGMGARRAAAPPRSSRGARDDSDSEDEKERRLEQRNLRRQTSKGASPSRAAAAAVENADLFDALVDEVEEVPERRMFRM